MDTESIVATILKHRPDLSKEDVLAMAREKMRSIGAGYLTEQGALFLVAADLGIRIDEELMGRIRMTSSSGASVALKDLYSGARDVSITARVMKIYPVKRYSRSNGTSSRLRRLVVYDNDKSINVNLWDDAADAVERLGIKAGDAIRISRAYVKSNLNGSLVINTGMKSSVESTSSADYDGTSKGMDSTGMGMGVEIMGLEDIAIDVSDVASLDGDNLVVTGILCSNPMISTYRNRDGEESRVMSMLLQGRASRVRVVIWDINYANLARMIPLNSRVLVAGVKVKRDGERVELHGDAGSIVKILRHKGYTSSDDTHAGVDEGYLGLMKLRILAINSVEDDEHYRKKESSAATLGNSSSNSSSSSISKYAIVMVEGEERSDEAEAMYLLDISKYGGEVRMREGVSIECIPSRILGYTIYLDEDSYIAVREDEGSEKGRGRGAVHEHISKIADVEEEHLYAIEAIVLTMPKVDEVRLRDGRMSRRAEVLVGDDTREARLIAWDRQVESIEALRIGERIRVYGVVAKRRAEMMTMRKDRTNDNNYGSEGGDDDGSANISNDSDSSSDVYELHVRNFTVIKHDVG
ncbi:hypothetical protein HRbin04_00027 [archaeon HR04]|nr:hypothetical protein HRbin04_00027 [archaeon HR04]